MSLTGLSKKTPSPPWFPSEDLSSSLGGRLAKKNDEDVFNALTQPFKNVDHYNATVCSRKRLANGYTLGGAWLVRRAMRSAIRKNYVKATAYAIPGVVLTVPPIITAGYMCLVWPIARFNQLSHRPRSLRGVWEWRLSDAIDEHVADRTWGFCKAEAAEEHLAMNWVRDVIARQPKRLASSEQVWWSMRKWSKELRVRELGANSNNGT